MKKCEKIYHVSVKPPSSGGGDVKLQKSGVTIGVFSTKKKANRIADVYSDVYTYGTHIEEHILDRVDEYSFTELEDLYKRRNWLFKEERKV